MRGFGVVFTHGNSVYGDADLLRRKFVAPDNNGFPASCRLRVSNPTTENSRVKRAGQKVVGLGELAHKRCEPVKEEQIQTRERRSALREGLLEACEIDIGQALRLCEERQVEVGASGVCPGEWLTILGKDMKCRSLRPCKFAFSVV